MARKPDGPELEEKRKAWLIWLRDIDKELTEDTSVWVGLYARRVYNTVSDASTAERCASNQTRV